MYTLMYASVVTDDRCELYYVEVTDRLTGEKSRLRAYPTSDYRTAVTRAEFYQRNFGVHGRFSYRVAMAS